jgi:hypothetical protein
MSDVSTTPACSAFQPGKPPGTFSNIGPPGRRREEVPPARNYEAAVETVLQVAVDRLQDRVLVFEVAIDDHELANPVAREVGDDVSYLSAEGVAVHARRRDELRSAAASGLRRVAVVQRRCDHAARLVCGPLGDLARDHRIDAQREVRAVLFGAANRDEHQAIVDSILEGLPGEFFHPDGIIGLGHRSSVLFSFPMNSCSGPLDSSI